MREVREVKCETFTGIMLTMLFVGMLTLVFSVQQAEVAEPPAAEWSRTYGGTSFDGALSFVQTSDGGYALAGYTFSFGAGDSDAWLVKVDSNGNMQWNKTYGGTERDIGMNTVETSDGGYALVCWTTSLGAGGEDFWLVKVDSNGNMQWNKTYGGASDDYVWSIVHTSDGGYALAGFTDSFGAGNDDAWLVKVRAERADLLVPYEAQGNAPWCWAASTAMVLRYYGEPVHVWDVGKSRPLTWSLSQIESYIAKTYPREFETKMGSYSSISEQTRKDIERNLSRGYPVLLNGDTPLGRHTIVVTGYNSSGFFINDPSGAFFTEFESSASFPYIHEFVTWEEFQPFISKDLNNNVFLVVEGTPSPLDATLFLINDEAGIRTTHDSDSEKGVCIDYGGWWWFLGPYWRHIGGHPLVWDSKDTLNYLYWIFNHKNEEARFDFHLQILGEDEVVYYESILDISVPGFDSRAAIEQEISLKDYLIEGQRYVVTAEISYHESQEMIDSIALPAIYYRVKSIMFMAKCPVRMLVTDPDGLRVGFDPVSNQTVNEIPNATYYYSNESGPELISIPNQKTENYSVTVFGIESGTYNLTCTSLNETGFLSTDIFINVPIENDESQTYIIPEFSSFLILPLFMIATLLAVTVYRRKHTM